MHMYFWKSYMFDFDLHLHLKILIYNAKRFTKKSLQFQANLQPQQTFRFISEQFQIGEIVKYL